MKKLFFLPLAVAIGLALLACQGAPVGTSADTSLSPREQDQSVLLTYAAMQAVVLQALQTPQVQSNPDLKAKLKGGEQVARAALLAYDDEARKCVRDDTTGEIGNAPGQICNPSGLVRSGQSLSVAIAGAQSYALTFLPPPKS